MKCYFLSVLTSLVVFSVSAEEKDWSSHILSGPVPQHRIIPSTEPVGSWAFQLTTKITYQDQDWKGNKMGKVNFDFRPRLFGYYDITDQLRFTGDIWMKYKNSINVFDPRNKISDKTEGYTGTWEHLQLGFEHEKLGAITFGAHATMWGGTVMDMHNALGMMDLQGNGKVGNKLFYINDFGPDNDLFIRGVYNYGEDEWGMTLGYQNYLAYAGRAPFPTYGIYLDINNEKYMSQSGDFGGGNLHNTDNDLVYGLSGFYGNGKGTYLSTYIAYGDDEGVDYEDQPIGFLPDGNPYGQGVSASILARHTFSGGFEPTVSFGRGGDGEYAIIDLAYQYNKHIRPYFVSKFATDDETQSVLGVRLSL